MSFLSAFTLLILVLWGYCSIHDDKLYNNIKSNHAETCGNVTFKRKGGGRTAQIIRYSYTVANKEYEGDEVVFVDKTVTFDDVNGDYIVIYNSKDPQQCVLDVYRKCK